jgi:hypothetical protein
LHDEPSATGLSVVTRSVAVRLLELRGIPEPENDVEKVISSGAAYEKFREPSWPKMKIHECSRTFRPRTRCGR